jgi:hypothetical protein
LHTLLRRNACLSRAADAWQCGHGSAAKRFSCEGHDFNARRFDGGVCSWSGVAGRDDGDSEDGTWTCARATVASPPSMNAHTAPSTSCASAALTISPSRASNVAYLRATRSSSAIPISSSTRASSLKSSKRRGSFVMQKSAGQKWIAGGLGTKERTSERCERHARVGGGQWCCYALCVFRR